MIIDSHQHFWNYNPVKDSWIDDSMNIIKRDFLPEDLVPIMKKNNVDGCIAVQADQSENETEFLLNCASSHNFIKGIVGWLDLTDENLEEKLEYYSSNPYFKGIRHIAQAEKDDFFLRKDIQNGIEKLSKYNLTFDILISSHQLPAAIAMTQKFSKQKFILDHIAKPNISEGINKSWKDNIIRLSYSENVFCKLSGMVTETKNFQFQKEEFHSFIDFIFKSFGSKRLMFGSDWPVCLLASDYKNVIQIIYDYLNDKNDEVKKDIMGLNAKKIYNL